MYEELKYRLWVHKMYGGTVTFKKLLDRYSDPEQIYKTLKTGKELFGIIPNVDMDRLSSFTLDDAARVIGECEEKGWHIIPYDSQYYPSLLRFIKDPPAVLFADGNIEVLRVPYTFAVVGSRDPSDSARGAAFRTGMFLSACSACVVSGGAQGIDSCAHEGAVLGPGGTVAVLGRGLGAKPVKKTEYMSDRIKSNGVYLTEYFPDTESRSFNFPKRNRIISGMSMGVAVIEAGEKSGALITAELAGKQSRKVFALSPEIIKSNGCDALLSTGAYPFENVGDILGFYLDDHPAWRCDRELLSSSVKSDGLEGRLFLKPGVLNEAEYAGYCNSDTADSNKKETDSVVKTPAVREKKVIKETEIKPETKNETKTEIKPVERVIPEHLSDEAKAVYAVLKKEPVYMDEIQARTELDTSAVMCAVTELELEDLAVLHPGNRISLI